MSTPKTSDRTVHAAALDDHVETYLSDTALNWRGTSPLIVRDAVEHGWYGATADIAERLEAIEDDGGGPYDLLKAYRALADELKREVGA
jgi:hypothetical protein